MVEGLLVTGLLEGLLVVIDGLEDVVVMVGMP